MVGSQTQSIGLKPNDPRKIPQEKHAKLLRSAPVGKAFPYKQDWEIEEVTRFAWIFHHAILRQIVHFPTSMEDEDFSSLPLHELLMPAFLNMESLFVGF
jgi:hypothetical protein